MRKTTTAKCFTEAEPNNLLRIVRLARSRTVTDVEDGTSVIHYRRARGRGSKPGFKGPAKVLCTEHGSAGAGSEGQGSAAIAWLSHHGVSVRATPEHLRKAPPLQITITDVLSNPVNAG